MTMRRTSEDVSKLIVAGINEQLLLHDEPIHMVFTKIVVHKEDNSAEMILQFMNTSLSVLLPFVGWSDWCRVTLTEPIEYRWYGEMEAQARQMIDLWNENANRIQWGMRLDCLLARIREETDGTDEWEI